MDIEPILTANRTAVEQMIERAERARDNWTTPRADGKWSPSQVVEHVARSLDEATDMAEGKETSTPTLPSFLRPLIRRLFLNPVIKKRAFFMKAKTSAALDPASGPDSPEKAAERLREAVERFNAACRKLVEDGRPISSGIFGDLPVADYATFVEIHTVHHTNQIPISS